MVIRIQVLIRRDILHISSSFQYKLFFFKSKFPNLFNYTVNDQYLEDVAAYSS